MRVRSHIVLALFTGILALGLAVDAHADIEIDFEDPFLGFQSFDGREIIDPYADQGVSFTAEPFPGSAPLDEVTGLVHNELSNACVEPANRDMKLGTGRELTPPNGRVGLDGYPIKATLRTPIEPNAAQGDQVEVSVDFQTVVGREVRMRLYDTTGQLIKTVTGEVTRNQGTCGKLGSPRGTVRLTAVTQDDVASMRFDVPDNFLGGISYVIDNFQIRFVLGQQRSGTPVGDLCARLASKGNSLPFTMHGVDDCQVMERWDDLGGGEVNAYVQNMMKIQVVSGRDLCNTVGGCTPCPIPQFVCPNLEFVFRDVWGHDLQFSTIFTFYAFDLDANLIASGQRQPDGGVRLFFTRPTIHTSGEEDSFFVVMRPDQHGLPWKFEFWGQVDLLSNDNPDPLRQFDTNGNLRIDNEEFYAMMDQWSNGFIPDALFFAGLDYWTNQLPINSAGVEPAPNKSVMEPTTFSVRVQTRTMTFSASDAASMRVNVYDTQGNLVFAKWSRGSRLIWNMQNVNQERVANGVYFVQMTSENSQGQVAHQVKKIALVN